MHGRVWLDGDADGLQAASESGRASVTVRLLRGTTVMATTTTDATGRYTFNDVTPGAYSVQCVLPSGMVFSPQSRGSDPSKDSVQTHGWFKLEESGPGSLSGFPASPIRCPGLAPCHGCRDWY